MLSKHLSIFLNNNNYNRYEILKRCLAAPAKSGAFSGGKLGGGVSKKGGAQVVKKVDLPVETDTEKLAKFCCGLNILKTGGVEVEIKPDSEYPKWLWELSLERGPDPETMDKTTMEYWIRKRSIALRYKNKLMKKEFPKPFIPLKVKNLKL